MTARPGLAAPARLPRCFGPGSGARGNYNPNYGLGVHSGNAYKLTTTMGGQWAAMKCAESTAPAKQAPQPEPPSLEEKLTTIQRHDRGITSRALMSQLGGKDVPRSRSAPR
ncbi:MAG: hypothetical protein RIT81_17635 [Deltaproteobacteria bacterium]